MTSVKDNDQFLHFSDFFIVNEANETDKGIIEYSFQCVQCIMVQCEPVINILKSTSQAPTLNLKIKNYYQLITDNKRK